LIKGLYTAVSGMMMQTSRQDTIANNIANAGTSGFKKQIAVSRSFPDMLLNCMEGSESKIDGSNCRRNMCPIGKIGTGVSLDVIASDFAIGNMSKTDNPTDFSIGNQAGYFAIYNSQGERYSRNGAFKINSEGLLTDSQGNPILDKDNNFIHIDGEFTIDKMGNIFFDDGQTTASLKIVEFDNPENLERLGDNLFSNNKGLANYAIQDKPHVLQGYLEQSNVNVINEMVELLSVVRSYESLQKVVQAEDEAVGVAINQVGSTS